MDQNAAARTERGAAPGSGFIHGVLDAETRRSLDGLTLLHRIIARDLPSPPMNREANMAFVAASAGHVELAACPGEHHYNMAGTVHGGWTATVIDTALGCSVLTSLEAGETYTTIEFKLNLVKPLVADGRAFRCVGTLVRRGRTIATSTAELRDEDGGLVAHAMGTCMIMAAR